MSRPEPIQRALALRSRYQEEIEALFREVVDNIFEEYKELLISLRIPPFGEMEIQIDRPRVLNGEIHPDAFFSLIELRVYPDNDVSRLHAHLLELDKIREVFSGHFGNMHIRSSCSCFKERVN